MAIRMSEDEIIKKAHSLGIDGNIREIASQLGYDSMNYNLNEIANSLDEMDSGNNNLPNNSYSNSGSNVPERLRQIRNGETRPIGNRKNSNNNGSSQNNLRNRLSANKSKNNSLLSRFRKKKNQNSDGSSENSNADNVSGESSEQINENKEKSKKKKLKTILLLAKILTPVILIIFLIIIIVSVIGAIFPFLIPSGQAEDVNLLKAENGFSQEEIDYYNKLNEVGKKYQNRCNKELDTTYINSSLIYLYYQGYGEDIDYKHMKDNVDMVYNLLPKECDIDYSVDGEFYNNLKNSSSFKNYYKPVVNESDIDKVLKQIFEFSVEISAYDEQETGVFIPENTNVTVDSSTSKTSNGLTSNTKSGSNNGSNSGSNNGSSSSSSKQNKNITSVTFKEYILGVLYANLSANDFANAEKTKAYIVAFTTNILAKNNLNINTSTINLSSNNDILYCNTSEGCSYTTKSGNNILQVGGGSSGNGNNIFYEGKFYYHQPIDTALKDTLTKLIDDIYGYVLVNDKSEFTIVDISLLNKVSGSTYREILSLAYPNLKLNQERENVYDNGVNYGNKRIQTIVVAYDQSDYKSSFCGLKNETIKSSGCGVTSMAIIASTYENNKKYDPVYMSNRAKTLGQCGANSGTYTGFFSKEARNMGYKYLRVSKYKTSDKNLVTSHLMQGHLIVIHVGKGTFTGGGHYMVLSGIDPDTKKVYVTDPYNKLNRIYRRSGSGWYSFNNIIIPQVKASGFHIIWKG